jgi:activator of 2-hydroxyglutaryl-CoA dehydratase
VVDFAMNSVCAAGTGSFLEQQAYRLGIPVEELGRRALRSSNPVRIAGRCTVFAESDMIHKQQMGFPVDDILYGLCQALVRNYLNNLAPGEDDRATGGSSRAGWRPMPGWCGPSGRPWGRRFSSPPHHEVMGALGAALLAREWSDGRPSQFRGF